MVDSSIPRSFIGITAVAIYNISPRVETLDTTLCISQRGTCATIRPIGSVSAAGHMKYFSRDVASPV